MMLWFFVAVVAVWGCSKVSPRTRRLLVPGLVATAALMVGGLALGVTPAVGAIVGMASLVIQCAVTFLALQIVHREIRELHHACSEDDRFEDEALLSRQLDRAILTDHAMVLGVVGGLLAGLSVWSAAR
jgi:hypothetical protein